MSKAIFRCLVCNYKTLSKRGGFEICPVCYWEDEGDIIDIDKPTYGPNGDLSLVDARNNFKQFGTIKKAFIDKVRKQRMEEL